MPHIVLGCTHVVSYMIHLSVSFYSPGILRLSCSLLPAPPAPGHLSITGYNVAASKYV